MKAYLIFVEHNGINSNKYYNMELVGSTINVEYGRVGVTKQKETYPASRWDSILKSKIKKGYTDMTLKQECTPEEESQGLLQTIYENGNFFNQTTLTEIRERINKSL